MAQRLVLSEPDFAEVVRQALRDFNRPAALGRSALLRSRVLIDRVGDCATAVDLQALLRKGSRRCATTPKTKSVARAVAYLHSGGRHPGGGGRSAATPLHYLSLSPLSGN